ncbi:MAG: carbon dioxide concentrating mechanism protein [Cyanobacteriota bacterium]
MQRLPLSSVEGSPGLTNGDVVIEPGAAIASGVLLQADPGSQLTICTGVSIATGAILHAYGGPLTIEPGATIGSSVLIIGAGYIGTTACIGAEATILNPAVAPGEIVPPKALLGDTSRQVDLDSPLRETAPEFSGAAPPLLLSAQSAPAGAGSVPSALHDRQSVGSLSTAVPISSAPAPVYGRAALQQLLGTLFPHRSTGTDGAPPPSAG